MRISDWSSDVCSSDLRMPRIGKKGGEGLRRLLPGFALSGRAALVGGGSARETLLQGGNDDGSRLALRERGVCHEICVEDVDQGALTGAARQRSEKHTSELQSLMRISYAVFCLKKKKKKHEENTQTD